MSMQELPHDGVAADALPAVSAPATPTPPTRVSVAAAASTLLLMDMGEHSSLGTRSRTLRTAASSWPSVARVGCFPDRSARCRLAVAWSGPGRGPDRSCGLER